MFGVRNVKTTKNIYSILIPQSSTCSNCLVNIELMNDEDELKPPTDCSRYHPDNVQSSGSPRHFSSSEEAGLALTGLWEWEANHAGGSS